MIIEVKIPKENDFKYDILIKQNITKELKEVINKFNKTLILTDELIPKNYYETLICDKVYIKKVLPGETSKTINTYLEVIDFLLTNSFSRNDLIIAFGGGVCGDLGGFIAATYKRGMHLVMVPTSTLSMVDSSIGGKNAINFGDYKNVIGTFKEIDKVFVDINYLQSLDDFNYFNGLMEAFKYGLIGDYSLYEIFKNENRITIKNHIFDIIIRSLKVKKKYIELDYYDKKERRLLNLGHTLAHGLELLCDIPHGYAVAIGIICFSNKLIQRELFDVLNKYFDILFYINKLHNINIDELKRIIKNDKKNDSNYNIVYLETFEKAIIQEKTIDEIVEAFYEIGYWK